jgi:uncharacterized membrane protein YcaP (DUF421 family)
MNETVVVAVRGIIAFFTMLIFARLLGKLQISQLTFFDYILGITIGSMASALTTDLSTRAWAHWMGLFTWTVLVVLLQWITIKWRFISKYIDGEPTIVIMNGQIMEDAMRRMRFRVADLLEQLRLKEVFDLTQVEFAIMETNGKLSVLKKSEYRPVTVKDMNLQSKYTGISTELISSGVVVDQNLKQMNLERNWLDNQLKKFGINDPSEVFLALLDTEGKLYIDTYKDHIKSLVDIGDYPGLN